MPGSPEAPTPTPGSSSFSSASSQMPSRCGEELSLRIPPLPPTPPPTAPTTLTTFSRPEMELTADTAGETRPDEQGLELRLIGESENREHD